MEEAKKMLNSMLKELKKISTIMWRIEDFTKTQMEYKITEIKISLNSANSTIDTAGKKKISELHKITIEISQMKLKMKKKNIWTRTTTNPEFQ